MYGNWRLKMNRWRRACPAAICRPSERASDACTFDQQLELAIAIPDSEDPSKQTYKSAIKAERTGRFTWRLQHQAAADRVEGEAEAEAEESGLRTGTRRCRA